MRILKLVALIALLSCLPTARARAQCADGACVRSGTTLTSVSSAQSEMLDAVMSSLLGGSVDLTLADHQALATANLRMDSLLAAIQTAKSLPTPDAAAQAELSLSDLFSAAASASTAQGLGGAATALNKLAVQSPALPGATLSVADLATLDTRSPALAASQINLLDFANATASVFNRDSVATVNSVHLTGAALGLGGLLNDVDIAARVLEPAVFVCGSTGARFYSAGIRLRVHADLVDSSTTLSLLGLTGLGSITLTLGSMDVVVEVARGTGTLQAINAMGNAVTVQATPGVASLYLGTLPDAPFLDRTTAIDTSTELGYATIAKLDITAAVGIATATANVSARGFAVGSTPAPSTLNIMGPFPASATASTQAGFVGTLIDQLANSLTIQVSAYTGALAIAGNVATTILGNTLNALRLGNGLVSGAIDDLTSALIDPLLSQLGVGIGEMDVTVERAYTIPSGTPCSDGAFCTQGDQCNGAGVCTPGTGSACASDGLSCTQDQCNEATDSCSYAVSSGCLIAGACQATGARNPADACQACLPDRGTAAWVTDLTGCDSDRDGLFDAYEQRDGQDIDTDGDANVNRFDPDDDDDTLPTITENADPNGNGRPEDARDLDGDRTPDYLDPDDDGDGKLTSAEVSDAVTWGDDVDRDGAKNWYDTDSDGDGALDAAENEGTGDINNDGKPDYLDPLFVRGDADKDGIPDDVECNVSLTNCRDSDGDGKVDYLDPDDDDDGVNTLYERPDAKSVDTDQNGIPDYLDPDNDGDGLPTRDENSDPNGDYDPRDARDLDGDGKPDYLDADDDDDTISTRRELDDALTYGSDVDGDGEKNWYDTNSDGDPYSDREEAVGDGDANHDGIPDYLQFLDTITEADAGVEEDGGAEEDAGEPDAGRPGRRPGGIAGGGICSAALWRAQSPSLAWITLLALALLARRKKG